MFRWEFGLLKYLWANFFFYLIATLGATCIVVVISGKEIQAAAIQSRFSRLPVSINATQLRERSQVGAQSGAECGA